MTETNPEKLALLVYDVPEKFTQLANQMRERIRKVAMPVNLSVYLFKWENRALVEGIVAEVQEETGQICKAILIEQAPEAHPVLIKMATESAVQHVMALYKGLITRIERAPALVEKAIAADKLDVVDKDKDYVRRVKTILNDAKKRTEELENLAFWLALEDAKMPEGTLKGWFDKVKELLETERQAIAGFKAAKNAAPVA